ncbi:metallophosphoesterase [Helicobacter sp. MIT 99-5507]|uniref:metallophosphoesterase n=1 Tax=Helicobacter sp. MIT 99-5507 TaxID=152489 RepID=UPI000E1ED541|nr:metallophosphoesterase [Helicobacter sp. MIT 99-5507]RDU58126.1 hypothetical protein CQA42_04295 [Helicobacter sp. MIT 99-5507]
MSLEINDDAIFIADSHIQKNRDALIYKLNNLNAITQKNPSQIIFLGDIANLLVGGIKSSEKINEELIECIKNLKSQIIYFEGNHDFNIKNILDSANIKVIPRDMQPAIAHYKDKTLLLAHGDIFINKKYEFYINTITSKKMILFLGCLDSVSKGKIFNIINNKVVAKEIKYPYNADSIINNRISIYKNYVKSLNTKIDIIIEGHFHIGKIIKEKDFIYIAMPSFYHDAKIFNIYNKKFETL